MTRDQIRGEVRALVGEHAETPSDDAGPLELERHAGGAGRRSRGTLRHSRRRARRGAGKLRLDRAPDRLRVGKTHMKVFRPRGVRIAGTGSYLPARVVSNAELVAAGAPLTDEEMVRLSGIRTRHHAAPHEATSDLAVIKPRGARGERQSIAGRGRAADPGHGLARSLEPVGGVRRPGGARDGAAPGARRNRFVQRVSLRARSGGARGGHRRICGAGGGGRHPLALRRSWRSGHLRAVRRRCRRSAGHPRVGRRHRAHRDRAVRRRRGRARGVCAGGRIARAGVGGERWRAAGISSAWPRGRRSIWLRSRACSPPARRCSRSSG